MQRVLSRINDAEAKAVLVGNSQQLQAIRTGAPLRMLSGEAHPPPARSCTPQVGSPVTAKTPPGCSFTQRAMGVRVAKARSTVVAERPWASR